MATLFCTNPALALSDEGTSEMWLAPLAFTYSASQNFMRFYLDGILVADTNEGHYWPPPADKEPRLYLYTSNIPML